MSRKFIAAVLAVSTAIATFSAAPARAASEEDIARILGAAATVFIIGKAIEHARDKDRKDRKKDKYVERSHGHKPYVEQKHHRPLPQVVPRHARPHHGRAALPAKCVRRISGGHVNRVVMERCLDRRYRSAHSLPRSCRMAVETHRGRQTAYALPCLRHRGYTVARN